MRAARLALSLTLALALGGCVLLEPNCSTRCGAHRSSSSLVEFLYPNGAEPPRDNTIPELHVPLRVGLTFLPARPGTQPPDAALREALLQQVRAHFSSRPFVSEIVIIPDYYLGGAHGFAGLAGVQRLYGVDVLALVSYDQVMHDEPNEWSLGYLSIVGAYLLKGDRYDTSTLIDLAVVDPASRSLILRAGGVDTRRHNVTLMDAPYEGRALSADSFTAASTQMIAHMDEALTDFQAQVRAGRANVHVVRTDGEGGGGALDAAALAVLSGLALTRLRARGESARPPAPAGGTCAVRAASRAARRDTSA